MDGSITTTLLIFSTIPFWETHLLSKDCSPPGPQRLKQTGCLFTWTAYISLDTLFGLKPFAFHGFSLAIHAGNAILAYFLCRHLGLKSITCLAVSLLWALHPLRVESVAWASSLKDLLSSGFALASILLVLAQKPRLRYPALLCFVASLLCKQSFVALPAFLFLSDFLRDPKQNALLLLRQRALWWLAALAAGLVTVFVNRTRISEAEFTQPDSPLAFIIRGLASLGHHLGSLFYPVNSIPEYLSSSITPLQIWLGLLALLLWVGSFLYLARKNFTGPHYKPWLYFSGFILLLLPLLGWFPSPMEFTADRMSYLPSLFAFIALGQLLQPTKFATLAAVLSFLLTLPSVLGKPKANHLLALRTTLNERMLAVSPNHPTALHNRAMEHFQNERFELALKDFLTVTRTSPTRASSWANAVRLLAGQGRLDEARDLLEKARLACPDDSSLEQMAHLFDRAHP